MKECEPCITTLKSKKVIDEEVIFECTCEFFNLTAKELKSKYRHRRLSEPRQMAMVLIKENTTLSLKEIGDMFGKRDHSTVIHAHNVFDNLFGNNPYYKSTFLELKEYIFT